MNSRIFDMKFGDIYNLYLQKSIKKNRTKKEVDIIICWLTNFNIEELSKIVIDNDITLRLFFEMAPQINPNAHLIKGVICGYRIEDIEDPLLRNIRYLDKLIDELAGGKKLENILRK